MSKPEGREVNYDYSKFWEKFGCVVQKAEMKFSPHFLYYISINLEHCWFTLSRSKGDNKRKTIMFGAKRHTQHMHLVG